MQNILDLIQCGIFVLTVESNPDVSSEDDLELTLRFEIANLAFVHLVFGERMIDQTVDIIGLTVNECLPLEFANSLDSHIRQCLQSQQKVEYEAHLDLITNRVLLISLSLKTCDSDNLQKIIGTCQNMTNLSKSKAHVRYANDQKFGHLVSSISDAFVVVDHEGIVRYVNHAAEEMFGCKAEDIIGESFGLPIVSGESTDIDILSRGKTTSAEMRVSETIDEDRRVYVVASLREVSERNRVEESLKLRERAIAASPNGIVITDATQPNNPMIYVNPSFERITGYSAAEVIGRDCKFLQGGDRNQIGILDLRQAIKEQRECHAVLLNYRKDGTPFWNDLYIAPVFNDHGELTNYIGIQIDVPHFLIIFG